MKRVLLKLLSVAGSLQAILKLGFKKISVFLFVFLIVEFYLLQKVRAIGSFGS